MITSNHVICLDRVEPCSELPTAAEAAPQIAFAPSFLNDHALEFVSVERRQHLQMVERSNTNICNLLGAIFKMWYQKPLGACFRQEYDHFFYSIEHQLSNQA
jgi:hypothetical protein